MEAENKSNVFMSSRHQNPGALTSAPAKKEDFTWAAIVGIIALLAGIAAVLLMWQDWDVISRV